MKKFILAFAVLAFSMALLMASVPTKDVGAQGRPDNPGRPDDPGHQAAHRADGTVVAPDGVVFESHKAFVDAGRRCNTRHADDIEIEQIDKKLAANRAAKGG